MIQNTPGIKLNFYLALDNCGFSELWLGLLNSISERYSIVIIDNTGGNKASGLSKLFSAIEGKVEYVFLCDDDGIVEEGCIEELYDCLSYSDVGLAEAMHPNYNSPICGTALLKDEPFSYGNIWKHNVFWDCAIRVPTEQVGGFMMLRNIIPKEVYENLPEFGEDRLIGETLKNMGFKLVSCTGATVIHLGMEQSHFKDIYDKLEPLDTSRIAEYSLSNK